MDDIKEGEIFKPYDARYFVSNVGRVWCTKKQRYLKPQNSNNYKTIYVAINGNKCKAVGLHRLVAGAFIPNPNNYKIVNHIDGNKINNSVTNLEWCTQEHNVQHAIATGLITNVGISKQYFVKCSGCTRMVDSRYLRTNPNNYTCQVCKKKKK